MSDNPIYQYVPHRRTARELEGTGLARQGRRAAAEHVSERFNAWLAVKMTSGVGTMWCAYVFTALALVSLPSSDFIRQPDHPRLLDRPDVPAARAAVRDHRRPERAGRRGGQASEATYKDAAAVLHEEDKIQAHLLAQDAVLAHLVDRSARVEAFRFLAGPPPRGAC